MNTRQRLVGLTLFAAFALMLTPMIAAATQTSLILKPSNTLLDAGQSVTFNMIALGGVGPYNTMLYNLSSQTAVGNVVIQSGGSNSLGYSDVVPSSGVVLPTNILNYSKILLTNLQNVSSSSNTVYMVTINPFNYSNTIGLNAQNVEFSYNNGTVINSFFLGNAINYTNPNNLNTAGGLSWLIKINPQTPALAFVSNTNQVMLIPTLNQPTCGNSQDAEVSDPSGVHGLFIYLNNITPFTGTSTYLTDNRICGVVLPIGYNKFITGNGQYNWNTIGTYLSPFMTSTKQFALDFPTSGVNNDGTQYMPSYILNNVPTVTCTGDSSDYQTPIFWNAAFISYEEQMISNISNHYQNNASIAYIRFGFGDDWDADTPPPHGSELYGSTAECAAAWDSAGLTLGIWLNYSNTILTYIGSLHSKVPIVFYPGPYWTGITSANNTLAVSEDIQAINNSVGVSTENLAQSSFVNPYSTGGTCNRNMCNVLNLYKGKTIGVMQEYSYGDDPSCDSGSLPTLFNFTLYTQGQVYEMFPINYQLATVPGTSTTISACGDVVANYITYSATYNSAITQFANVVGYTTSPATIGIPQLPPNSTVNINIDFAAKATNLMNNKVTGENPLLSYSQTGSCTTYDNGANVFTTYNSFCGINYAEFKAMGWSNTVAVQFTFTPTNLIITGQSPSSFNVIYKTSPLPANLIGTMIDDMVGLNPPPTEYGTNEIQIAPFDLGSSAGSIVNNVYIKTLAEADGITQTECVFRDGTNSHSNNNCYNLIAGTHIWGTSITQNGLLPYGSLSIDYNAISGASNSITSSYSPTYLNIGLEGAGSITPALTLYWIGTLNSPPKGINPSTSGQGYPYFANITIKSSSTGGLLTQSPSQSTYCYSLIATDTGTAGANAVWNTTNSASCIQVSQALADSFNALYSTIDIGQNQTLTATTDGGTGTPPYTYNIVVYNAANNLVFNYITSNDYSSTYSLPFTQQYAWGSGTFTANVAITDSASSPSTTTNSLQYTVLPAPTYTSSGGYTLYIGQSTTLTGMCQGTDTCTISVNGAQVASTSNTVTYLFQTGGSNYGFGTYKIKFCDVNTGGCTPDPYLTVYAPIYIQNSTANPSLTLPISFPVCTANQVAGTCQGTDTISGTNSLTGNLFVKGNVVQSGTLTFNGFAIIATGKYTGTGGTAIGGQIPGGLGVCGTGQAGMSYPNSYGGSGGGGESRNGGIGGAGGNTLSAGGAGGTGNPGSGSAGSQPSAPTVTNANIIAWFNAGFQNYLNGASGGGAGNSNCGDGAANGGAGSKFIYIQANQVIEPTMNANGIPGTLATNLASGSGAGAIIIVAYGAGGDTPGTTNVSGGPSVTGVSGTSGGAGASGRVVRYNYATPPLSPVASQTYPFLFYTSDNTISYTLNQISGATQTTIAGPTNTLNFIPPSNQPTSLYNYNVIEYNGVSTLTVPLNLSVNMQDISSNLGSAYPCNTPIQYFPDCSVAPTFTATPTSWYVKGDNPSNLYGQSNSIFQGNNIDVWSNANTTFTPNVILSYGQFSPAIAFPANLINNPSIGTITQNSFKIYSGNTLPAPPYTRNIINIVTENEGTLAKINTSTTASFSALFNNYTINNQTITTGYNSFRIYMPQSVFQNPSLYFSTLITSSSNSSYFPANNNFCPGFVNATNPVRNLYLYLVSYATGQSTTVDLQSNYGGANNGEYLQVLTGVNPTYATVVQQVLISTQNFLIPLIIGNSYSAIIVDSNCKTIYQTPSASQSNPWNINIVPTQAPPPVSPQVNATCTLAYNATFAANTITCAGSDNQNLVNQWNVSIYNSTGFLGLHLVASNVINGGSFKWQYYPVYLTWGPISWRIVWNWNDPSSGSAFGTLQNIVAAGFNAPFDVFLTIAFILVGIVIGNATGGSGGGNTHKLSNTMFIVAFILFFCYMVGISQWLGFAANASLIMFLVVLGLIGHRQEGGVYVGG